MKSLILLSSFAAFLVSGCVRNPDIADPSTVLVSPFGDDRVEGTIAPGGLPSFPAAGMEKERWEGYRADFQPNSTYDGVVRSYQSANIDSAQPAYRRFAPKMASGAVGVRVVVVGIRIPGRGPGFFDVPVLASSGQYLELGQRVLIRTVGAQDTGYLSIVEFSPTRYTEGYPLSFAPNRVYPAQVLAVHRRTINRSDVQFPRIAEVGKRFSDTSEVQVLNLAVMGDDGRECVQAVEPVATLYRAGDLVDYRTYGIPATGFASVKMRQAAGTGSISRTLDPDDKSMYLNNR